MARIAKSRHNILIMPKQITPQELQIVLDALTAFPAGASVEHINRTLAGRLSHRTLQRRLALLVSENRLTCEGRGRATRYRLAPDPSYPPLSPDRTVVQTDRKSTRLNSSHSQISY